MPKRFQFRLQTVLRVREVREREAKRRVGKKWGEIALLDSLDRDTTAEIDARQRQLRLLQDAPRIDSTALVRQRAWIAHLRKTMLERQVVRRRLAEELRELQAQLAAARTQTRMLEKLRERGQTEHRKAIQRFEQAQSDELAQRLPALSEH
ncbi:MAG: flagellar FliJ family protein [Phycisphaerae bacterium]